MNYTNHHILEFLEEWAPGGTKLEYDNIGLLVGDPSQEINKLLLCLEITPSVLDEAIALQADLILAHHPLIFKKLSRILTSDTTGSMIRRLIKTDISLIAAHTNLDAAPGGVSFTLADRLGLRDTRFLKTNPSRPDAISPIPPDPENSGFGTIGYLSQPLKKEAFLALVREKLNSKGIRYNGSPPKIEKVAVCGGSGAFLIPDAIQQGADAYLTADIKYHDFFIEKEDFLLVDGGHYETEVPVLTTLCERMQKSFPELEILITGVNTNPVSYFFNNQH